MVRRAGRPGGRLRNPSRQEVVQAFGVLGVRLERVTAEVYAESRDLALAGFKGLMIANHPDRHDAGCCGKRAVLRTQELSAAEHLVRACRWPEVADLFREQWQEWRTDQRVRYYQRCPRCGVLNVVDESHACRAREATCDQVSPGGAVCSDRAGHVGWHSGWGRLGRHTWTDAANVFKTKARSSR